MDLKLSAKLLLSYQYVVTLVPVDWLEDSSFYVLQEMYVSCKSNLFYVRLNSSGYSSVSATCYCLICQPDPIVFQTFQDLPVKIKEFYCISFLKIISYFSVLPFDWEITALNMIQTSMIIKVHSH